MEKQDYNAVITATITPAEATEKISDVAAWWAKDIDGSAANRGDVFTVHFGDTFVTFEVTELEPGKKVEWLVTDSHLPWLKDKTQL